MVKDTKTSKIAFGIYFYIALCFILIRMLSSFGFLNFLNGYAGYAFTIVIQVVLLFGGSVFVFSALNKKKVKDTLNFYNYKRISIKTAFISVLVGVVVFFLNVFISSFFSSILSWIGYKSSSTSSTITNYPVWLLFVNIIFTAVLPAICEETAHRGMILSVSNRYGYMKAILISSILFGLLHLNIEQFFYATIIGLFLGYITPLCGSIFPAMIVHFMNNALSVYLTFANVRGLGFAGIFVKISAIIQTNAFIGIIFVIAFVILLLILLYKLTQILMVSCAFDGIINRQKSLDRTFKKEMFLKGQSDKKVNLIEISDKELLDFITVAYHPSKMDKVSKILLILTIIMTSAVTIFTLVWGLL